MTFSYQLKEGVPTDRDKVRLYIGDTIEATHEIEDEEIDVFLADEPNRFWAAAAAALAIARKLDAAYYDDIKVGETRLRTKRINELIDLSKELRARGAMHMLPSVGGIYKSKTDEMDANTDIKKANFDIGMHDAPGTTDRSRPPADTESLL